MEKVYVVKSTWDNGQAGADLYEIPSIEKIFEDKSDAATFVRYFTPPENIDRMLSDYIAINGDRTFSYETDGLKNRYTLNIIEYLVFPKGDVL